MPKFCFCFPKNPKDTLIPTQTDPFDDDEAYFVLRDQQLPPWLTLEASTLLQGVRDPFLLLPVTPNQNLILHAQLLRDFPEERFGSGVSGAEEIKSLPYFEGIDWNDLSQPPVLS